jgi:glycosyltransferase involved in cell wall biosynthesis
MKKVLIFSLAYYPYVGGAEVAVKEITDRIPEVEFHMITMRFAHTDPSEEIIGAVHVHRIGSGASRINKLFFQFLAFQKAASLHAIHRFDAMWALMAHSAGVPAALFKMRYPDVGYVLNLQEGDPPEKIERTMWPLWPLFKRAFTLADIVQPISTFLGEWARRRGFTGTIEIIPNGVDVKKFSGEHVPHAGTRLITTSRLVHKNAVDDVIRALALLPDVRFTVLGVGPDEAMLKDLAQKECVSDRVEFIGHIHHHDMLKHLLASDIFIRPSRSEGMGSSFIEAMAVGLPVVATQEGGIADFLFDEHRNPDKPTTGWAVDKNSPEQIASAVKDIIARPEKVKEVVAHARKMVLEKYDWDIIARDMRSKVFEKVFAKN